MAAFLMKIFFRTNLTTYANISEISYLKDEISVK